jgi:hypothetical protein
MLIPRMGAGTPIAFVQAGTLTAVKTIPAREAAMTGNRPAVVAIEIRAVNPDTGGL